MPLQLEYMINEAQARKSNCASFFFCLIIIKKIIFYIFENDFKAIG